MSENGKPGRAAWKAIALPAEHGSWGLTLEPILAGMLTLPSWPGLLFSVAAFAAFLMRWPLRSYLLARGRERKLLAWQFSVGYGMLSLLALLSSIWLGGWAPLIPLLVAIPFGLVFVYYDWRRVGRTWQAELAAPIAFAGVVAVILLLGGAGPGQAYAFWLALAGRSAPSIFYVRARLNLDKEREAMVWPVHSLHLLALMLVLAARLAGYLNWATVIILGLLLLRSLWGLSPWRLAVSVPRIGVAEMVWGFLLVLALAYG
jgi:hypothetical protein